MRLGVRAALVDGDVLPGDVDVDAGDVTGVGLSPAGAAGLAVPGFVDLQVNGYAGADFLSAPASVSADAATSLASTGVTAFLAALVSAPESATLAALAELRDVTDEPGRARLLGVHLEGPFLAASRRGAHDPDSLRLPDTALAERLCAAGHVAMVTLAPELDGALDLVASLSARRITVSLGHSDADAATAAAAFDRGARTVTHIFNAMPPIGSRSPGIAGAALARRELDVMAILDGIHLAPATEAVLLAAAGGRVAAVSDCVEAAGLGDGTHRLGGVEVTVTDGTVRTADGTLAGSAFGLDRAVRHLVELGRPLEEAVAAVTTVPARILGRDDVGRLAPRQRADIAVLDDRLEIRRVLAGGVEVS